MDIVERQHPVAPQPTTPRRARSNCAASLPTPTPIAPPLIVSALPEPVVADPRIEAAVKAELVTLDASQRFLLAAYYLDHRTLAEIAKLQGVHESTISRKLERITTATRKSIRRRMMQSGMSTRQADEAIADVDVRDLRVAVRETLRQDSPASAFYEEKGEPQ